MEENKIVWILGVLDMLSERAREFTHVSRAVLEGEGALQSKDGKNPDEWQVACVLSAFINYVAERNRCRYGHFAFDLETKNNENKRKDAQCVLDRMQVFWERSPEDDEEWDKLSADHLSEREEAFQRFIENDRKIREHLKSQPDVYAEGISQSEHREWMIKLRLLGESERHLIEEWKDLICSQRESINRSEIPQISSPPP